MESRKSGTRNEKLAPLSAGHKSGWWWGITGGLHRRIANTSLASWIQIALANLAVVALLGLVLRGKILFNIPFLDFRYLLHAHSHFAFGGWITVALLSLMAYIILPSEYAGKAIYKWMLTAILITSYGMLFTFPFQGYGLYSILFSNLFIFSSYAFTVVFIKDIWKSAVVSSVKVLSIGAVIYMSLSSAGAFTLAYLMATKSQQTYLYRDAIYSYLHLQYSGFFSLSVFALMLHYLKIDNRYTKWFTWSLTASVLPTMFLCYLWHEISNLFQIIAFAGSILLIATLICFLLMLPALLPGIQKTKPLTKKVVGIAMIAFIFKLIFQALTIIPSLGVLAFSNRPIIIGFLHLVLLGFVSLFILAYCIENRLFKYNRMGAIALWTFVAGIVLNELALFSQGLGYMLMMSSSMLDWLLLLAAVCLCSGALLMAIQNRRTIYRRSPVIDTDGRLKVLPVKYPD
ncbi:hypothetical protein [Chitinophaga sp. CF418]|uniref:hypothetical protein n=1 Tax=Chitinophaga sp. CF418 TaxID=1855287 RepID=UPI00122CFC68|nr:hypothetical protein [Chitinophaga sp. CF418]